jgi:hypothetical protein
LSDPPSRRPLPGGQGTVSAAGPGPGGTFRLCLNATPRQGAETLAHRAGFRLKFLRAAGARLDAAAQGVRFRGGTGSRAIDDYLTNIGARHDQEIACLVQARTSASVIAAAAPAAWWATARPLLVQAAAAYQVRRPGGQHHPTTAPRAMHRHPPARHIPPAARPAKARTMPDTLAARPQRPATPPRRRPPGSPGRRTGALPLRRACAALLAWIGSIHLHLRLQGYRQIPANGPPFLLDAAAGFTLAALPPAWPAPPAGPLATGHTAATPGALLISLTIALSGFRETTPASYVAQSLTIEPITVPALAARTVPVTATPSPPDHPPTTDRPTRKAEHPCSSTPPPGPAARGRQHSGPARGQPPVRQGIRSERSGRPRQPW